MATIHQFDKRLRALEAAESRVESALTVTHDNGEFYAEIRVCAFEEGRTNPSWPAQYASPKASYDAVLGEARRRAARERTCSPSAW